VLPSSIEVVDVGPRDGLQNEQAWVDTALKVQLIERLLDAGVKRLEVASFVRPEKVPQMMDAEQVLAALPRRPGVTYIGVVLNKKGALRALEAGVQEIGTVAVASDTFGQRNQNQTMGEALLGAGEIMRLAREHGRTAQVGIAMAFGCPFEGRIDPKSVIALAKALAEYEPSEIGLADTIGVAVPGEVSELVGRVREAVPHVPVRVHFHNTRNTAVANVLAAVEAGARTVDASVGGIGGCPFAPDATGNVATEDVVYALEHSGVATGIRLGALIEAARFCSKMLGRPLPGMVSRAGDFPRAARSRGS
jgi:hydroxymethylglutaryl-CoA lyase